MLRAMTYRGRQRSCPACAGPMEELRVPTGEAEPSGYAEVDRCAGCGGLFLEFFDGEPSRLSRAVMARPRAQPRARPPAGVLTCCDCERPMVRRPYLGQGPDLARCEACLAVFLSPAEAARLAQLTLRPEVEEKEPSWLVRLLRWLPGGAGG
jgi:hypothetical protein